MPEESNPLFESLEDRCMLSAHMGFMPPMALGHGGQACIMPMSQHGPQQVGGQVRGHQGANYAIQSGTVTSVDAVASTLTIATAGRHGQVTLTTFNVSPTATITIDGAAATLDQLVASVKVNLQADPADATTLTSITATGQKVEGCVLSVDTAAGTLTLAGRHGAAGTTYTIGKDAVITVNDQAGALAGLAVGAAVKVQLSALDSTQVLSVDANVRDVFGTVVSVDAVAGTITVSSSRSRGKATQTTCNVSPTASIMVDGTTATLDQLVAGVKVTLKADPMDAALVASITAVGQKVEGRVLSVDTVAGTVTLAGRHGAAGATYTVGKDAVITVNDQAGALAGIAAGAQVEIQLSALDSTAVIAVDAKVSDVFGTVVSVDSIAGTITLSASTRGKAAQTTYAVSPTATIVIDGVVATLDQLVAGVKVTMKTDPMDAASIASITAIGTKVEGRVKAVDAVAGTLTLAGRRHSAGTTYTIGATVPVIVDGVPSTLAAVTAGSQVDIRFSALDSTVVISVEVE